MLLRSRPGQGTSQPGLPVATVFGAQPVRVILVREPGQPDGYQLALVSTKHAVSFADMLTALRRAIIAAQYQPGQQVTPTPAEILQVQQAWAAAAA